MLREPPLPAPRFLPAGFGGAVVLSVPHSGRDCPAWLASRVEGGARALERLSDPYMDDVVAPLIESGMGAVIAETPRGAIDVNRPLDALDPDVHPGAPPPPPGSKADQGLGLVIARGAGGRKLWREPVEELALAQRIDSAWQPYHSSLAQLIERARIRAGIAVLLDCHSMPPRRRGLPPVVLGDRHGRSAAPWVASIAAGAAMSLGFDVGHNRPYAGGEIARAHGRPKDDVHVLQIEIDRSLYLDRQLRRPGPGLGRIQKLFSVIAADLEKAAQGEAGRLAAE
ncbi:N-formylglutamate amidohydrolase [Sphingomicrobium sediminis]|uniref:N-formylglutamate amidohydrolase n=1 Tax=Sphingomicrobium sediminis TaxID=2950949 RepID=A0A9X2J3N9_9SPHN|nr:N-formylglutamate amidohydrolase [Sphingomicrobium sediminis]MCM8556407.1 N-formylglutamate amidohydrolase [Sphingomicrobium sediminis]